ncbi:MAG TPA: adenylyl-sulfate kinase [Anaeromyxobacteraceae bacterium]|nr:adenylyl-sulfate kinase [Anaeromyxobacteraceae bacterium]
MSQEVAGGRGAVVWLTGLPASGKSTLAARLADRLRAQGRAAVVLDSDAVRRTLVPAPGYSPAERDAFYETLARLSALVARQGLAVLVAATAPRRAHRAAARALAPRFVEVFVDVPAEECARRDPKGLWARARAGEAPTLPGAGAAYEPPEAPEVRASGGEDSAALEAVLARLG